MDMKQYDEAADAYLRLSGLVTVPARKDEALSGYMKAVVAGGDDGKILAAADEVAARAAGEPAKRQALYAKASVLRRTGRNSEALPLYERLGSDVSTPEGAEGAYRVIEAARAAGENARVEELVYAFADRNTPHSYWLGKSFIILGDIYAEAGCLPGACDLPECGGRLSQCDGRRSRGGEGADCRVVRWPPPGSAYPDEGAKSVRDRSLTIGGNARPAAPDG